MFITTYFRGAAAALLLLLSASTANSRVLPTSIGLRTGISGNGLAPSATLTMHYAAYKWEFVMGLDMQYRHSHISGLQTTLYYYPMYTNVCGMRLGLYSNVRYNFSGLVNKNVMAQENYLQKEARRDFSQLTLSTVEGQAGFALRISHGERLRTFYAVGFGVYHTLGGKENYALVHREFTHVQLVLDFGLALKLARH